MTESTWAEVGEITVKPTDSVVEVGSFELSEGADTIWVRMTNTGDDSTWPWSYGILSFKTEEGQPLGSIKAYNSFSGEVFRLGVGLAPSVRSGKLTFEPRGFNLAWVSKGNPWPLKFEAQSGGESVTRYWNRDPVNGVLSPVTPGDDVNLDTGDLSGAAGTFSGSVSSTDGTQHCRMNPWGFVQIRSKSSNAANAMLELQSSFGGTANTPQLLAHVDGSLEIGGNLPANPNITLRANGSADFSGVVGAPNITFRSNDPAFMADNKYVGPELDLLEELVRLESLVKHLYETLRMAPPSGWEVWDGSPDLVKRLGKKPKNLPKP